MPGGLAAQPHPDDSGKKRPAAGGVLSDIFGLAGRRILAGLTGHVRGKLKALAETLAAESMCNLHGHL